MTNTQQLQKELDTFNASREAAQQALTVADDFPEIKRTYKIRSWVLVKANQE